jgi:malate dehydrogenase (quinone)
MIVEHSEDKYIECDVVLIGAGIMSATLGALLKELQPDLKIEIFERLPVIAAESSDAWNNAGTGHAALCELNYTPEKEDGSIDISKAIKIMESFEVSKQFWAYLLKDGYFQNPRSFLNPMPHISLVMGEEDVTFLKKRYETLCQSHLFGDMQYTENHAVLAAWMPLVMAGRNKEEALAATKSLNGTDVDFGALTRGLFEHLKGGHGVEVFLNHEVENLWQEKDKTWSLRVENRDTGKERNIRTKFVFIGAGGGSLPLLEKSDIPEGQIYGGFPVSGQWLICKNKALVAAHHAKVYGKAAIGAPPMSVPHLDTRIINGEKALLFGPYAGFTTKFLKEGSIFDLPLSIHLDNISAMFGAWIHNLSLTKYLISQVTQGQDERMEALLEYMPTAVAADWELAEAGKRVQVIKKDEEDGGVLEFGTEIVTSQDGTIAALLGASPGASTAVQIMLDLLTKCFPEQANSTAWKDKLQEMIPSYGKKLRNEPELTQQIRAWTHKALALENI